jgi:hypothetical protein
MNTLFVTAAAAVLALGSMTASAADLTPDERTELRQRADEWQRVRAQNPNAGQGDIRLDRPQGDVKIGKPRGEVKAKPKSAKKKTKREPAENRVKRTARDVPGALVRK